MILREGERGGAARPPPKKKRRASRPALGASGCEAPLRPRKGGGLLREAGRERLAAAVCKTPAAGGKKHRTRTIGAGKGQYRHKQETGKGRAGWGRKNKKKPKKPTKTRAETLFFP